MRADEWVLLGSKEASTGQGRLVWRRLLNCWNLSLGIPAPSMPDCLENVLYPLLPLLGDALLHLPKACEKIEGTESWKQDSLSQQLRVYLQTKFPGFPGPSPLAKRFPWASPSRGSCCSQGQGDAEACGSIVPRFRGHSASVARSSSG